MKSITLTQTIFVTVDKQTFTDEKKALKHQEKLEKNFKEDMDLRKFINVGEEWLGWPSTIDKDYSKTYENFIITEVSKTELKGVSVNTKIEGTFSAANWNKDYIHQIFNMIEKFRCYN